MSCSSPTTPPVFLRHAREDSETLRKIATAWLACGVEMGLIQNAFVGVVRSSWLDHFSDPAFGNLTAKNAKNAKNAKSAERTRGPIFVFSAFFAVNWID